MRRSGLRSTRLSAAASFAAASLAAAISTLAPRPAAADEACIAAPSRDCVYEWSAATARAESIDEAFRIATIALVARVHAEAGRTAAAHAALREAMALARALPVSPKAADAVAAVGAIQFRSGLEAEGMAHVRGVTDVQARDKALAEIARHLIAAGRLDEGVAAAGGIENGETKAEIMAEHAAALTKAGRLDEAWRAADALTRDYRRSKAFAALAVAFARAGRGSDSENALRSAGGLARSIGDEWQRSAGLAEVAVAFAALGRYDDAEEAARRVEHQGLRNYAFHAIATAQAEAGRLDDALQTMRLVIEPRPYTVHHTRRNLALALVKAGRLAEAAALAARIDTSNVNGYRSDAFSAVAIAHVKAGRLAEAAALARTMTAESARDRVILALIPALAEAGQFGTALELARAAHYPNYRAEALAEFGAALTRAGRDKAAGEAFGEALKTALEQPEGFLRAQVLLAVAKRLPR